MKNHMVRTVFLLATAALLSSAALAEEILFLKNGSQMPIRGHEIRGDMIHVDLGENAFIAFPAESVEKIEQAGKTVVLRPSTTSNQMFETRIDPNGSFPIRAHVPAGYSGQDLSKLPSGVEQLEEGMERSGGARGGVTLAGPPAKRGSQGSADSMKGQVRRGYTPGQRQLEVRGAARKTVSGRPIVSFAKAGDKSKSKKK